MFTSPDMSEQVEMSAYCLKANEIFKLILEDGNPKSSYDLIFKKGQPTGTVHRHIKRMLEDKEIVEYGNGKQKRGKKSYGPTFYGLISYYRIDKEFTKNIEKYFDLWKSNKDFHDALELLGFSEQKMSKYPNDCKKMFRMWIEYFALCEAAYDKLAEDPYELPYESQQFLGAILLGNNKKANQYYQELYVFSEHFRNGVDAVMEQMTIHYNQIKSNHTKLQKKWL